MNDNSNDFDSFDEAPPPVSTGMGRRIAFVFAGLIFAAALLAVLLNNGTTNLTRKTETQSDDDIQILTDEMQIGGLDGNFQEQGIRSLSDFNLPDGGWVQQFDENGNLKQSYRTKRVHPTANNLEMEKPEAVFFLSDGRIMMLQGDKGNAVKRGNPNDSSLETGTITGNVVIRLYRNLNLADSTSNSAETEEFIPELEVLIFADQVYFDDERGEIRCDEEVNVQTPHMQLNGERLTAIYDKKNGLQSLNIERVFPHIHVIAKAVGENDKQNTPETDITETEPEILKTEAQNDKPRNPQRDREPRERAAGNQKDTDRPEWADRNTAARDRQRRAQGNNSAASDEVFYRATFYDNVRITREGSEEVIEANEMQIIFSMQNESSGNVFAYLNRADQINADYPPAINIISLNKAITSMIIAITRQDDDNDDAELFQIPNQLTPRAVDGDIFIAFDGRMMITPLRETSEHLATTDDVFIKLIGEPVRITDTSREVTAIAGTVEYLASTEELSLFAQNGAQVEIHNPQLIAKSDRLDYRSNEKEAEFVGPGTMHLKKSTEATNGIDISWEKGVDITLAETNTSSTDETAAATNNKSSVDARLKDALFRGDVNVSEDRFNLKTETLQIGFNEPENDKGDVADSISVIKADGNVRIDGLDENERIITSEHLQVDFEKNAEGKSNPRIITVWGNAHAEDNSQSISADEMIVTLIKTPAPGFSATPVIPENIVEDNSSPADDNTTFNNLQTETVTANENVIIKMPRGTQATGDTLVADLIKNIADLKGKKVIVTGSQDSLDFVAVGTHASVEQQEFNTVITMLGAGNARIHDESGKLNTQKADTENQEVKDEEPRGSPEPVDIDVDWSQKLTYTETDEGSGDLELLGNVIANSVSKFEENSIQSAKLHMLFDEEIVISNQDNSDNEQKPGQTLHKMIASGAAVLESRVWTTLDHSDKPRLIHIKGQHVEYNQKLLESRVIGPGQLLIDDPRPIEPEDAGKKELTGKGVTLFEWTHGMTMTQLDNEQYEVIMQGDVTMRHLGTDDSIATLSCNDLNVVLSRRDKTEKLPGIDLGGSTEVQRFIATGSVYLDALKRKIDCDRLIYDQVNQKVEIFGTENRDASIQVQGAIVPTRAKEIIWFLNTDQIQIKDLRSTIPRGRGG